MLGNGPLAAAPLASQFGPPTTYITEQLALTNVLNGLAATVVHEHTALTDLPNGTPIKVLTERLAATGTPYAKMNFFAQASSTVRLTDQLHVVWRLLITENLTTITVLLGTPRKFAQIVEHLKATGVVSGSLQAYELISVALAISSHIKSGWKMTASSTVNVATTIMGHANAMLQQLEHLALTDSARPSMHVFVLAAESVHLYDTLAATMNQHERIAESVLLHATIRLGDTEYIGWVLNEGAPTQYTNYPFNSFANADGKYYGASAHGLYLLEGTNDAGTPIDVHIKTALMDFGTGQLKRIPEMYVSFAGNSPLLVKVITPGQRGTTTEVVYTATVPAGAALHDGRVLIGQGVKGRYFQFVLENTDGGTFEVDEAAWRPMILDRRM